MKSAKVAAQFLLLNALLSIGTTSGGAAQAKYSPSQHGGQAAQQMNSDGSAHRQPSMVSRSRARLGTRR